MSTNNLIYTANVVNRKDKKFSFKIWKGSHYIDEPSDNNDFGDTYIFNVGVNGIITNLQKQSGKVQGTVTFGVSFKRMIGNGNFFGVSTSQWDMSYENTTGLYITTKKEPSYLEVQLQSSDWKVGVFELPIKLTWNVDKQYSLSHKVKIKVETLVDNTEFYRVTIDTYEGFGSEQEEKGTLQLTFNNTTVLKSVTCQLKGDIGTKQYGLGDITTTEKVKTISVNSGVYSIKLYSESSVSMSATPIVFTITKGNTTNVNVDVTDTSDTSQDNDTRELTISVNGNATIRDVKIPLICNSNNAYNVTLNFDELVGGNSYSVRIFRKTYTVGDIDYHSDQIVEINKTPITITTSTTTLTLTISQTEYVPTYSNVNFWVEFPNIDKRSGWEDLQAPLPDLEFTCDFVSIDGNRRGEQTWNVRRLCNYFREKAPDGTSKYTLSILKGYLGLLGFYILPAKNVQYKDSNIIAKYFYGEQYVDGKEYYEFNSDGESINIYPYLTGYDPTTNTYVTDKPMKNGFPNGRYTFKSARFTRQPSEVEYKVSMTSILGVKDYVDVGAYDVNGIGGGFQINIDYK